MVLKRSTAASGGGGSSETGKVVYDSGTLAQRPSSPTVGTTYFNTTTGELEIFQTGVWSTLQLPVLSKAPTVTAMTDNGTGRAYGDSSVTLTYTLSDTGGYAGNYTAVSSPSGITQNSLVTNPSTSNQITITTLPSNTNYTFTLRGNNNSGAGATTTSSSILATSVPEAIQGFTASNPTTTTQTVTLTPGNTGGKSVVYNLLNNITGGTITQSSPVFNLTGLVAKTSYTFTATATNSNGTSIPVTSAVFPTLGPYLLLATITSSQTFTVPSGVSAIAVAAIGPGANGATNSGTSAGQGGNGGAGALFWNYPVSPGNQFAVGVPQGGGTTTFGSVLSVGSGNSITSTAANFTPITGGSAPSGAGSSAVFPSNLTAISGAQLSGQGSAGAGAAGSNGISNGIGSVQVTNRYLPPLYNNYYTYASAPSNGGAAGGFNAGAGGRGGQGGAAGSGTYAVRNRYSYFVGSFYSEFQSPTNGDGGSNYGGGGGGAGGSGSGSSRSGGTGGQGVVYVYGF